MKLVLILVLGLAGFLILGGVSLLFGQPSSFLSAPTVQSGAAARYASELVIEYDVVTSWADGLAAAGGALVLGGLMISASAYGRQLAGRRTDGE